MFRSALLKMSVYMYCFIGHLMSYHNRNVSLSFSNLPSVELQDVCYQVTQRIKHYTALMI